MNKPKRGDPCTYCGAANAGTMDHVPPKSILTRESDSVQFITVPACHECHRSNQGDDPTIRNFISAVAEIEKHPLARNLVAKRDRSLDRSPLERGHVLSAAEYVGIQTPGGIYLGEQLALNWDNPVMNRFVERLARAILRYDHELGYFKGSFGWHLNAELPNVVYEGIKKFGKLRKVNESFAYGSVTFNQAGQAYVGAQFFGWQEFFIQVVNIEAPPGMASKPEDS